ncbi:MAG: bifunctional homocysteine S-methyltransferase/methylenetetrahydrofolate reductase [Gemmiger sp.]
MEIKEYLAQGTPLLFDGAMGTCYAARTHRDGERCEPANLEHPEEIAAIHRAYLEAGCRAIKTNTFALGVDLAFGEADRAAALLAAACRLAKEAAAPTGAFVFADIGPAPQQAGLSPAENYCRQIDWFAAQGLTCFLLETLPGDEGVAEAAAHLKATVPGAFLLVSFAVNPDGTTRQGRPGQELLRCAAALETVDAVGLNCVSGPQAMLALVQALGTVGKPLAVMPNAGYPTVLGRRAVYQGKPEYFAFKLGQMARAGAAILGGCCGTTPEHLAAAAAVLRQPLPETAAASPQTPADRPAPRPNPLWDKLNSGRRVIAVELDPPVDDHIQPFMEGVRALHAAGADAITIADCPVGRPRADSSLLACKVKRELGIEPLPHMTCRDRNLNATKALLLGLSMEDVHNVLVITGDPIPTESRDEVKGVFNFNSRKLAAYIGTLNDTVLATPFRVYGALNLNARNFDVQLRLAREKEASGICGFLTQPVLSARALENLKLARAELQGKILGGIFPVVSYRNACFLNNEIAGMDVCEEITALYRDKNREEGEALAVTISTRVAAEIAPYVDGYYLMTPFRRVALMQRILAGIRAQGLA